MAAISTGNNPELLWPGIFALWGILYPEYQPEWSKIYTIETSRKAYEKNVAMTTFGLAKQIPEGGAIQYDDMRQSYVTEFRHDEFGLGFIVTKNEIQDNQYAEVATKRMKATIRAMHQTKEWNGAEPLNYAFTKAGADGQPLCSLAHPTDRAGDLANRLAYTIDMSELALEAMTTLAMNFVDTSANKVAAMCRKLIVPASSVWFDANRILKSELRSGTADNDINVLRNKGLIPEGIEMNHYLTNPKAFFLLTDIPEGLTHFRRTAIEFGKDNEFETSNARYKAFERYKFGYTDWRCIIGNEGQ